MDQKSRSETREYLRGYHDAKDDHGYDDGSDSLIQLMTLGFLGNAREGANSYRDGYKDGREDRKQ